MQKNILIPKPLIGDIDLSITTKEATAQSIITKEKIPLALEDYEKICQFLQSYKGSQATFNSYRREMERFLQWLWLIAKKSLKNIDRKDIEEFLNFCQKPPESWIGLKHVPRFILQNNSKIPHPDWRPFVAKISKKEHAKGTLPKIKNYMLSQNGIQAIFAILGSFYNYLIEEDYVLTNPVKRIRQKSKFLRRTQTKRCIRRLSEIQWQYIIRTAEEMAKQKPLQHERTLFIMSALYSMYLRISELVSSDRWSPMMKHFHRDHDGNFWFTTVGKGNKERDITVSDTMLSALKRYRTFLGLSPLPAIDETTPLIAKTYGRGPVKATRHIRRIVQTCFDAAVEKLKKNNLHEEAEQLMSATVHWLRHTGISEDVKTRPREHVRDDAGHSSSAITDRYIDIEMRERHLSGKKKLIKK